MLKKKKKVMQMDREERKELERELFDARQEDR